jgi:peptidoglycan/LPS O-acetylase OafA/YrhL
MMSLVFAALALIGAGTHLTLTTERRTRARIAAANLGFGVLGVLCVWRRGSWWSATAIGSACFLWGAAYTHIYDFLVNDNRAIDNIGPVLYTDIFVPLAVLLLLAYVRRAERTHTRPGPADTASVMARAGGRIRPQPGA